MFAGEVAVDRLEAAFAAVNQAQAAFLSAVYGVVAVTPVRKFAAEELAAALAMTTAAGRVVVESACELVEDYPAVFAAVQDGRLCVDRASMFARVLRPLDRAVAAGIAAEVLPIAHELTLGRLRRVLLARAMAADPAFAAARREQSVAHRRVELGPQDDGTAILIGVGLPAERAVGAWERIDAIARARKAAGDASTLDQLRTDAYLDLLEGTPVTGPTDRRDVVELRLAVTLVDGKPVVTGGELAGFGPVSAEHALEIAMQHLDYPWQLTLVDQEGELLATAVQPGGPAASGAGAMQVATAQRRRCKKRKPIIQVGPPATQDPRARYANAATARWVRTRDRTCRFPGCHQPATRTDLDHTVDHSRGGNTRHDNFCPLCRRHHNAKHRGRWKVTQPRPGHFRWVSPLGRIYDVGPEPP